MATALGRAGGDAGVLREVAALFLDSYPAELAALRAAVARGDGPAVRCAAHALKGSVSTFGAPEAVEAAGRLEEMGRAGDLGGAREACAALEAALARLGPPLAAVRDGRGVGGPSAAGTA
jgi:HPt (histidine-containing phosphotransfer) domain-containing protein